MKPLFTFLLLLTVAVAHAQVPQPAFRTFDQIFALIPLPLKGDLQNDKKQDAAVDEANRLLRQNAVGKTTSLKVTPGTFSVTAGKQTATATAGPFQIGSRKCEVAIKVHENQAVRDLVVAGALNKRSGGMCDLKGTITGITLVGAGKGAFRLEIEF